MLRSTLTFARLSISSTSFCTPLWYSRLAKAAQSLMALAASAAGISVLSFS